MPLSISRFEHELSAADVNQSARFTRLRQGSRYRLPPLQQLSTNVDIIADAIASLRETRLSARSLLPSSLALTMLLRTRKVSNAD